MKRGSKEMRSKIVKHVSLASQCVVQEMTQARNKPKDSAYLPIHCCRLHHYIARLLMVYERSAFQQSLLIGHHETKLS